MVGFQRFWIYLGMIRSMLSEFVCVAFIRVARGEFRMGKELSMVSPEFAHTGFREKEDDNYVYCPPIS